MGFFSVTWTNDCLQADFKAKNNLVPFSLVGVEVFNCISYRFF